MEFTFLGGAGEVGGSCMVVSMGGHQIVVDGGMRPAAGEGQARVPDLTMLERFQPEAVLITHAHIDHTGALPLIAALLPDIPIYATESTCVLTEVLLRDAVRIMEQEQLRPDAESPLYSAEQVDALLARLRPVGFAQAFAPIPSAPELTVTYLLAGHILGAGMLYFQSPEGTLLHTGDISVTDQRTVQGVRLKTLPRADVMICEGTYGNRAHTSRKEEERKLVETVQAALARGGRVLCPVFAVGRAQEMILILKSYRTSGRISPVPLYIDGMVRSICDVYQRQSHDLAPSLQSYLLHFRRPILIDPEQQVQAVRWYERKKVLRNTDPKIIISSSGMLSGGASSLYAQEIAQREQDCILFTGYQDEESPGAAMLAAQQGESIRIGEHMVTLNCQVERYNLSAHADAPQLQQLVSLVKPQLLVLVHGEPEALEAFAQRYTKRKIEIPTVGSTVVYTSHVKTSASVESKSKQVEAMDTLSSENELRALSIEELWQVAYTHDAARPWRVVELGQHYYGAGYQPTLRTKLEDILQKHSLLYFRISQLNSQWTFTPRTPKEIAELQELAATCQAGEVVLFKEINRGTPQIGVLLAAPHHGTVMMISDRGKASTRPLEVIKLRTGLYKKDWLEGGIESMSAKIQAWRKVVQRELVDLLVLWEKRLGHPFGYEDLQVLSENDEQRLSWGLALLEYGREYFERRDFTWYPLEPERVLANGKTMRHLDLVHAGAGTQVVVSGQRGQLTGRSTRRKIEVAWLASNLVGKVSVVKAENIVLDG